MFAVSAGTMFGVPNRCGMLSGMPPSLAYGDADATLGSFKQLQITLFARQMQATHVKPITTLRQQVLDDHAGQLLSIVVIGPQCIPPAPEVRQAALALLGDPSARSVGTAIVVQGTSATAATIRNMVASMLLATRANDRPIKLFSEMGPASDFLAGCGDKKAATEISAAVEYLARKLKQASP